jgi:hypothetical protein
MSSVHLVIYHNQDNKIDAFDCPAWMIPVVGDTVILADCKKYRVETRAIIFPTNKILITVKSV